MFTKQSLAQAMMEVKVAIPRIVLGGVNGITFDNLLNNFGDLQLYPNDEGIAAAANIMSVMGKKGIWRSGVDFEEPGEVSLHLLLNENSLLDNASSRHVIADQDNYLYHPLLFSPNLADSRVDLDALDHLVKNTKIRPDIYVPDAVESAGLLKDIANWAEAL